MRLLQYKDLDLRRVKAAFAKVRAAIEADPKNPKRILTVRGVGYVFAKQQD